MSTARVWPLTSGTYEDIAAEYYDSERHPTCANFSAASRRVIESLLDNLRLSRLLGQGGAFVDVGAGKSVLSGLLKSRCIGLHNTVAVDRSPSMLRHSERYRQDGLRLVVADARQLPFAEGCFDFGVAALADPYNESAAWMEAQRVLAPGALWIATFPSFEWAQTFRESDRHEREGSAYFVSIRGSTHYVPSIVLNLQSQCSLFERAGFRVIEMANTSRAELTGRVSRKLDLIGSRDPVVVGFALQKK